MTVEDCTHGASDLWEFKQECKQGRRGAQKNESFWNGNRIAAATLKNCNVGPLSMIALIAQKLKQHRMYMYSPQSSCCDVARV